MVMKKQKNTKKIQMTVLTLCAFLVVVGAIVGVTMILSHKGYVGGEDQDTVTASVDPAEEDGQEDQDSQKEPEG